jgi:hypothetical protein
MAQSRLLNAINAVSKRGARFKSLKGAGKPQPILPELQRERDEHLSLR